MALVKYGGGVIQMSGSIAGTTHARNRYGNYVRAKTKPVNPNTNGQQRARSAIAELTERWYTIVTALQRTAWNLYADSVAMKNKLGETIKLSGFNHYIRSNSLPCQLGITIVDAAPVDFTLPDHDPAFTVTATQAPQQITWAYDDTMAWATETGSYLFLFQGKPQNPTRNFFAGPWKYTSNVAGIDGAPPASPLLTGANFPVADGQRLWCYARIFRKDGRISTPFRDDCFVTA